MPLCTGRHHQAPFLGRAACALPADTCREVFGLSTGSCCTGLMAGCPTTVVPFFGDQSFWGGACKRLGVGPAPIAIDDLTTDKLVAALQFMRQPEALAWAKTIAAHIAKVSHYRTAVLALRSFLMLASGRADAW